MQMTTADRSKITALAGKLGSDHDGEIVSAVAMLKRIAGRHRLKVPELIAAAVQSDGPAYEEPPARGWPDSIQGGLRECLQYTQFLNAWEVGFCRDVAARTHLTAKQRLCAEKIIRKVRANAGK